METEFSMEELFPVLSEVIASGGGFRLYPQGTSMLPLLRAGRDSVLLTAPHRLSRGDICLYQRENGDFVLHRLVRLEKSGLLTFRGDNQIQAENGVRQEQIIARVCTVYRGEKPMPVRSLRHRFYRLICLSAPMRALRFRNASKSR